MADKEEKLLTPREAAALLGVQAGTIRQYVSRGILKPAKRTAGSGKGTGHSRFSLAQVEALKSQRGTHTPPPAPRPAAAPKMVDLGMTIKLKDEDGKERDAKLLALMLE